MKQSLAAILLFFSQQALSEQDTLDYLYTPPLSEETQIIMNRMMIHARNAEFDQAQTLSQTLLNGAEPLQTMDPKLYGEIMVNHGIIQSASEEHELGLSTINRGLEHIEEKSNPFSKSLINAVMAKALTEMSMGLLNQAEDSFRRAQHITHRQEGIYSEEQLIMVNYLTKTSLRRGASSDADTQQLFSLLVAERIHGPDSTELLPTLNRLGGYFASRGTTIPVITSSEAGSERSLLFKHSLNAYERAIGIIEQNYGEHDLRLMRPLRGLASARIRQNTGRRYAEPALLRALDIVSINPDAAPTDQAQALIDLGDLYIIRSDQRAGETYVRAWQLLQEMPEAQTMARSAFDTPVRLLPKEQPTLLLDRMPDAAQPGDELYVSLRYDITADGRVEQVKVLDRNVPNEQVRLLRTRVKGTRYRPRIEDGQLVRTDDVDMRQLFRVPNSPQVTDDSDS